MNVIAVYQHHLGYIDPPPPTYPLPFELHILTDNVYDSTVRL